VGPLQTQHIENRHRVGRPQGHGICLYTVRAIASTHAPMVHEDEPELVVIQRLRDGPLAQQVNRVQKPAV
jgi:hypothetical protein